MVGEGIDDAMVGLIVDGITDGGTERDTVEGVTVDGVF